MRVSSQRKSNVCLAKGSPTDYETTGEGHFDDGNKPSGTATPVEADPKAAKKRKGGSKKAKTTKQRLAIADGEMDL
jgi:hypothetical protein